MFRLTFAALLAFCLGSGAGRSGAQSVESGAMLDAPPHGSPLDRVLWDVQDEAWKRCSRGRSEPVRLRLRRDAGGRITVLGRDHLRSGGTADCLARSIEGRRAPHTELRPGVVNRVAFPRRAGERPDDFDHLVVVRGIRTHLRAIVRCYEPVLRQRPSIAGKVVLRFTIEEHGRTTNSHPTENTTGQAGMAACVAEAVAAIELEAYPVGGSVDFSYPFVFAPQD